MAEHSQIDKVQNYTYILRAPIERKRMPVYFMRDATFAILMSAAATASKSQLEVCTAFDTSTDTFLILIFLCIRSDSQICFP
jgi:hypothetical protein